MNYNKIFTQGFVANEDEDEEEKETGKSQDGPLALKMQKAFLEKRKLFFWGPVFEKTVKPLVAQLLYLEMEKPGEPITLYINSPGGSVTEGMIAMDTIKLITSPVHTVCIGLAASMGSLLLSAGAKGHRRIWPSGEVMIHQPSIGGVYQGSSADLEIQAEQIRKAKEISAKILADNCGQPLDKVTADFERDYWMDANEALSYGIVDKIETGW
jgi:ATP-dependent Clp protease, protease subunit